MRDSKLRRQIAREAARLVFAQETEELFRARLQAQRRLQARDAHPHELPSQEDIADEIAHLAQERPDYYHERTMAAADVGLLQFVRLFAKFRPRVEPADRLVRIHLCGCSPDELAVLLVNEDLIADLPQIDPSRFVVEHPIPAEITLHPCAAWEDAADELPADCRTISELEQQLAVDHPALDLSTTVALPTQQIDRFLMYRQLLLPLEEVQQDPVRHPEGDALYHSMQVFTLAKRERPYDEEFLLAALLHDVGKAIDPQDHVTAALEELGEFITERTRWFIEFHHIGRQQLEGTLGHRASRRLQQHPDYEELILLARCDRAGCVCGAEVPELDDALSYLRRLAEENG